MGDIRHRRTRYPTWEFYCVLFDNQYYFMTSSIEEIDTWLKDSFSHVLVSLYKWVTSGTEELDTRLGDSISFLLITTEMVRRNIYLTY